MSRMQWGFILERLLGKPRHLLLEKMLSFGQGTFYFALLGATAAAVKHFVSPLKTLQELTPVAVKTVKDKKELSPGIPSVFVVNLFLLESLFWGSYAFSSMNLGFATVGAYASLKNSDEGKKAVLLGTGILFWGFALAWNRFGHITGKPDWRKHSFKMFCFGSLFVAGFWFY